jgi:Transposase DDE domain group 1
MTECIPQLRLCFHPDLPVVVEFDAPEISSDGGALLLRQVDECLGLSAGFSACLLEPREHQRVQHSRQEQSRQRIFQIALGYEDCNDADRLRHDPLLKTVCDRTPQDPQGLSSQPTLSRFENAQDAATLKRLVRFFEDCYVSDLPADTQQIILDIDSTDDETHGAQQLSFFSGFYREHMYHPLMIFDAESGQLVTALLRPGKVHASRGAAGLLRRVIRRIKQRFPQVQIAVRGDSGFCTPLLLETLEQLNVELGDVEYLFGLAKNPALLRQATAARSQAEELFRRRGEKARCFTSFSYAARSWSRSRFVVAKVERCAMGENPRFVISSLEGFPADLLYQAYCERGQCENLIKDLKNALQADRLSCSSFRANFFRLLLHTAAYRLLHALRQKIAVHSAPLGRAQFDTLRLRLLKVAAWVTQSARRVLIRLPKAFPWAEVFGRLATELQIPPAPA